MMIDVSIATVFSRVYFDRIFCRFSIVFFSFLPLVCKKKAQKLKKRPVEIGLSLHPKNDYGILSYDLCMYKSPHKLLPTQTAVLFH